MAQRRAPGRPREPDHDTSTALARAALLRFSANGYDATSLREIAADANVDVSLIAYRFGGKIGLWKFIVSHAATDLRDAITQASSQAQSASAVGRMRQSMQAFIDYLLARPEVPRLLLHDITIDSARSQWLLDELSLPLHQHFVDLAEAAAEEMTVPPAHLKFRIANFIYSAASTVARRERLTRLIADLEDDGQFEQALKATLITGVLPCA